MTDAPSTRFDPQIGLTDRIGSALGGIVLVGFAVFGNLENTWIAAGAVFLGVIFLINGIGGT